MSLQLDRSDWVRLPLGAVATASKEKVDPSDGTVDRYVAGEHMDSDDLKIHRWGKPSETDLGPAFHRRFRPGQVLYGSRRTYLRKVAVADFDGVCANTTFVVQTKDPARLLPEFLPFVMSAQPFHAFAIAESKGSVNPYVNWSDVERYVFELPPVDEQKRIADLLWAIERERRSVTALLEQADSVRNFVRDDAFFTLSAGPVRLDSFSVVPSQNGVTLKKSDRAGQIPMVNMGEMFRGEVISTDSEYERVVYPGDKFLLAAGDLLFARRSIVFEGAGTCCLVPDIEEPFTFESSVIRVRLNDGVDPSFVLQFFRSQRGRDLMSSIVRRGPVSGIAGSDLRTLELPVPDIDTQRRIVEKIERAGTVAPSLHSRMSAATGLLQAMLAALFGGD